MFAVVLVVQHQLHLPQSLLQPRPVGHYLLGRPMAPLPPLQEGLRQVVGIAPGTAVDQPLQTGPVGPRGRAVDRTAGPITHQPVCGRQPLDQLGEGIAEEAGDAHRHRHPWPAELGSRDQGEVDHAAGGAIPHRLDPQQGQHLGDIVAAVAHRAGAPDGQGQVGEVAALLLPMLLQQDGGAAPPQVPGRLRGQSPQVDAVEVAARRQHIRPAPGGGPRWSCLHPAPGEGRGQGLPFGGATGPQARPEVPQHLRQLGLQGLPGRGGALRDQRGVLRGGEAAVAGRQPLPQQPQAHLLQQGHPMAQAARPRQSQGLKP